MLLSQQGFTFHRAKVICSTKRNTYLKDKVLLILIYKTCFWMIRFRQIILLKTEKEPPETTSHTFKCTTGLDFCPLQHNIMLL